MRSFLLLLLSFTFSLSCTYGQGLRPGFDKAEYIDLLKVCARHGSIEYAKGIGEPEQSTFIYRSPVVGLENQWDLWIRKDKVAIISLRGTTASQISWIANFYAAMVPAIGTLQISKTEKFSYHLADNPKAAVHIGWLVSTAFLSKDILPKIDSVYKAGIKDILIMGHSQGGAIAYLLTSHLYSLRDQGKLPADLRFKTYCSAGPKPGNLYYAHEYAARTQYGWAYNVVNSADWVPETPVSIQTIYDFNNTNAFAVAPKLIKKQKFPMNLVGKYAFNRLKKPPLKAQRKYEKYLGRMVAKPVAKHLPGFVAPEYYPSNDFVRTGNIIVLLADEAYYKRFKDNEENVFIHHLFEPYLYLSHKLPDNK